MKFLRSVWFPVIIFFITGWVVLKELIPSPTNSIEKDTSSANAWQPPAMSLLPNDSNGELIRYGKELIINTAGYFGPKGTIGAITNGMNCQNCHVAGGTAPYGNCFSAVAANYPKFRERSGKIESIAYRINECMERSLNGESIDTLGKEMRAMIAYIKWVGSNVPKGVKPVGAGTQDLHFMERAANPQSGKMIYEQQCLRCHGINGEGKLSYDGIAYTYPPLWGEHSYNVSAGLYRITKLAAYIKDNMPFGIATHESPQLTDEQAWDVAAFIGSQPRPQKLFAYDWPVVATKPVDYPFGPYTDGFSETQHKYGPFQPIAQAKEARAKNKIAGAAKER